jgi:hypothetical protein
MAKPIRISSVVQPIQGPIDCACVIHGDAYDWIYVERLYNMLNRHLSPGIRLHVYTEADRPVPSPMIKHELEPWPIAGPKKAWWYKMQMFNAQHHRGALLYFDLDVVITENIDWIWQLPLKYFWAVHDFKHLWRPTHQGLNSSVLWWDTELFHNVWKQFKRQDLDYVVKRYHGDQDYISDAISQDQRRFFDSNKIKSWRWQVSNGGYDFKTRRYLEPGTGTSVENLPSVLIFHGKPKPADVLDPVIVRHWQ